MKAFKLRREMMVRKADLFSYKVDNMAMRYKFLNPNVKIYVKMFIEGLKRNLMMQ